MSRWLDIVPLLSAWRRRLCGGFYAITKAITNETKSNYIGAKRGIFCDDRLSFQSKIQQQ